MNTLCLSLLVSSTLFALSTPEKIAWKKVTSIRSVEGLEKK